MVKTTSKKKALALLAELDENENVVHREVRCYKKTKRNGKVVTKQLVCHTEAQVENFYLPRQERSKGSN
jgi:hypothetical protein